LTSTPAAAEAKPTRHQIMYAHHMWRQQRFFAGFLVAVGIVMTGLLAFQGQLLQRSNLIWTLYFPSGLLLGGAFLLYRWRSHVRVLDTGLRISTLFSGVTIDYNSIRGVKVQALRNHFQERRSRLIAPVMKQQVDKPALFIRVRGDDSELAVIKKKLGARLMNEDTIAVPVPDADALAWEITSHLPERIGQNLGGGKRRKRRR
jgi:hypothetical protein